MTTFVARVSDHQTLATTLHLLRLELVDPARIEFQAGQYISLLVDKSTGLRRSYSFASAPSMKHAIDLLVDVSPHGPGTKYIQNLKAGNNVEFMGPMGELIVRQCNNETIQPCELLFVATGCGIAPIRSMILDQLIEKQYKNSIRLWWGMRHQEDCFWEEDFDLLEKEHPNFEWDLILSKPPEDWPLHSGHATEYVVNYVSERMKEGKSAFSFYLCGNQQMITNLSTKLKELDISSEDIHFERFC